MNLRILASLGLLAAFPVSAATMDAGSLSTSYFFTGEEGDPPLTSINQSTSVTVDLSDLTGLTPGDDIAITLSTTDLLLAQNGFLAADGDLTLLWLARFTLSTGTYSTFSEESSSLGPVPWVSIGSETVGYWEETVPQSLSLVVPWGTDLSSVTLTMTDLFSVSGVNTQVTHSSLQLASATLTTTSVSDPSAPEIALSGNDIDIANGDTTPDVADHTDFGVNIVGEVVERTFTIVNQGTADLSLTGSPMVTVGPGFSVSAQPASNTVGAAGGTQTFTIRWQPNEEGNYTAMVSIANDDSDENPFTFAINGLALDYNLDSDSDGLSDASEFEMAALGFDWQVSQTELVGTYYNGANKAGLFTKSQIQALNVDVPLLQRDPLTGQFMLTLGLQKSTTLEPKSFAPFPMTEPQTSINGEGKLEFEFTSPDDAAFFRLEAE